MPRCENAIVARSVLAFGDRKVSVPPFSLSGPLLPSMTNFFIQSRHDPAATKAAMDGFQSAFAMASELGVTPPAPAPEPPVSPPEPPARPPDSQPITLAPQTRDGMVRRVPGAQLAPGLRKQPATKPFARATGNRPQRDPAAERAAFDAFADGLAKAGVNTADTASSGEAVAGRVMERGEESR